MARRVRFWGGAWWPGIQTNASAQVTDVAESSDQWILRQREDGDEKEKTLGDHGKFAEVPRLASVFFYCLIPEGLRGRGQTIWFQRGCNRWYNILQNSHKFLCRSNKSPRLQLLAQYNRLQISQITAKMRSHRVWLSAQYNANGHPPDRR